MSAAERVRELARQMRDEVRSIERRKFRTANEAERKVLDLIAAQRAASEAAIDTHRSPGGTGVGNVSIEALSALNRVVREVAVGPFANEIHPAIVALGLALGLSDMVRMGDRMWDATLELQVAAANRLELWARTVEMEGGVCDGY